jgi:chromosome segregation ATPase
MKEDYSYAEAKGREFEGRIRELESKLSDSVPRTELDAAKAEAEGRMRELQASLSESKSEADALKGKVAGFESRVAQAEWELEALNHDSFDFSKFAISRSRG